MQLWRRGPRLALLAAIAVCLGGALPASAQWTQVWSDEFNGTSLNTGNWSYETGGHGWGNNELQHYTSRSQNVRVTGGNLVIEAHRESFGGNAYTSARIRSIHKRFWRYGKIEARIQVPSARGIWPAFWMMGENFDSAGWPRCGEIDIMEHPSGGNLNYGAMHWDWNGHQYYTGQASCGGSCGSGYRIYGIEWTPTEIRWYLDGVNFHTGNITINNTEEFHNAFFALFNVAVGGNWPGPPDGTTTFPQRMLVDWVRVYQQGGVGPTPTPTPSNPGDCYTEVTPGAGAVTASANDGNGPGNTVDNSLSTRWSASGDPQWIRWDLGSTRMVGHVRLAFYSGNTRRSRFDLQTSTDGSTWTNALTGAMSSGTTTQEQTFDFSDRNARYVRYLGHGNTVNAWNSLTEASIFARCGGTGPGTPTPTATPPGRATPTPGSPGTPGGTHKRLKITSGCSQPMWIQYLAGNNGGTLNAPNRFRLGGVGSSIEYDIPDRGLAGLRVWPGFGCDGAGNNCIIGASGGPPSQGFSCPDGIGCSPPLDSKWEGTFGCIPGVSEGQCQPNPSGGGAPLGRGDFWNSSFVDGYTVPMRVNVVGHCPVGPQPAPVFGPGGPPGGVIDCSNIRYSDCPTAENLSTDGQFSGSPGSPGGTTLASQNLLLRHPNTGTPVGCFSPSGKLTMGQWQAIPKPRFTGTYYNPPDPQARMYACPSPPITPDQCSAGPASRTQYTNMIHSKCQTYAYPYDDAFGLASCPAATNLRYEVTFYCPQ
jgi:beta-glucanase (GH16 family)